MTNECKVENCTWHNTVSIDAEELDALRREVARLKADISGQRGVLVSWIRAALLTLETIDPDDLEDSEPMALLLDAGRKLSEGA